MTSQDDRTVPAAEQISKGLPEDIRLLRGKIARALYETMGVSVWTEGSGTSTKGVHTGSVAVIIGTRKYMILIEPMEGP